MANQLNETTLLNNEVLNIGTSGLFQLKYNSTSGNVEITDGTNVLLSLADSGTTGTLTIGALSLTGGAVIGGTWTPTCANVTNVASIDFVRTCFYQRIGNIVFCTGDVEVTPTAGSNTATAFSVSLPIASDFASQHNATGQLNARRANNNNVTGDIVANTTNDNVELRFGSIDTNSHNVNFQFSYVII